MCLTSYVKTQKVKTPAWLTFSLNRVILCLTDRLGRNGEIRAPCDLGACQSTIAVMGQRGYLFGKDENRELSQL